MSNECEKTFDVYISCAPEDREAADSLAEYLSGKGMTCRAGDSSASEARVMVLLFTEAAQNSDDLINDIKDALDACIQIIPYRMTEKEPTGTMGFYLKPLHWLDAFGGNGSDALKALSELCSASIAAPVISDEDEGPEMALLRKKTRKRRNILLVASAVLILIIIVAAAISGRDSKDGSASLKNMSCKEFMLAFADNLDNKYGSGGYEYFKSDTGEIKYSVWVNGQDDGRDYITAVIRFFDKNDGDPVSEDSGFTKIGLTNTADQHLILTEEEWTPYIKAFLATLEPGYSEEQINDMLDQLYNTENGGSKIIGGNYTLQYTTFETMYLIEVTLK